MAFKWADEMRDTKLLEIEWSPSRTGLINPVAIFDPVELEGTTVSRASVHNISIMRELKLGNRRYDPCLQSQHDHSSDRGESYRKRQCTDSPQLSCMWKEYYDPKRQ